MQHMVGPWPYFVHTMTSVLTSSCLTVDILSWLRGIYVIMMMIIIIIDECYKKVPFFSVRQCFAC